MRLCKIQLLLVFVFLLSCKAYKPVTYVVFNNESKEKVDFDIVVSNPEKNKILPPLKFQAKPGLQEIPIKQFKQGLYALQIHTHNGQQSKSLPLRLDSDRWVMVTYIHQDSMTIQKKFGFVDTGILKKNAGKYSGIDLYIENRRPPNL
ncbi:MAG: hypothetical protein IBJ16_15125 [Chitinophagaceae bacterium]|nr:hypothetical protein [Chitinophagaceae bacterium]